MADCYTSNDSQIREELGAVLGITDINAVKSEHDLEPTGNEVWRVHVDNTFAAKVQPETANQGLNRKLMDERVGRQKLALMRGVNQLDEACADITTKGRALAVAVDASAEAVEAAANNADMAEFTCLFGRYVGAERGNSKVDASAWMERLIFEFTACPSAID